MFQFKLQLLKGESIKEKYKRWLDQKLPEFRFDTIEMFYEHVKEPIKVAAAEAQEEEDLEQQKYIQCWTESIME